MGTENVRVEPMDVKWLGPQVTSVKTVSDSSSNLSGKYFLINSGKNADKYFVWLKIGSTSAPSVVGRTAVSVDIAANESKESIASKIATALNALSGKFKAVAVEDVVTITTRADGKTDDSADGGTTNATGFEIKTVSRGAEIDLGLLQGDIELSFAQDNFEVKAHQTGSQTLDRINTGTNLEAIKLSLLETHAQMLKDMMGAMGEAHTPENGTEVIGIGTSRRFSVMSTLGKKLVLHPRRLPATDRSKDLCFWKATPQVSGLNFSGESASVLGVDFLLALDDSKIEKCNLSVLGDWTQNFDKTV